MGDKTNAQQHLEPLVRVANDSQPHRELGGSTANEPNVALEPQGDDLLDYDNYDIEELRHHLGIGGIENALKSLTEKITDMSSSIIPESGTISAPGSVFDPTEGLNEDTGPPTADSANENTLESSEFLPSIFQETETFGPEVAEVVAKRINDSVCKKPLEEKLKELKDKYKTPKNCNLLCVPRVNLELWHDLPRNTKTKDLGLQEIQKNLVKSAQPMIQLLDMALKAQKDKKSIEPNKIMSFVADAVTFLGHTSYLTSLKRREFLKPDIAQAYQSVCSKSNPMTTFLFGDELPKHIKEISEVNKIAKKTMTRPRTSLSKRGGYDYKSSSSNTKFHHRGGGRRPFLSYGNKAPYADRRQTTQQTPSNTKVYRDTKDKTT